jgi:tRNA A37 threonylcarbamoyladenosine biosynthesis protein TsaE
LRLVHIDLYRLETRGQIVGAGLEEYFSRPTGVAVIEWAEKWFDRGPTFEGRGPRVRRVNIEALSETERRITYEDFGP